MQQQHRMDDVGVSVQMKAKTRNNAAFNFFFYYYIFFIGFGSGEWDVNEGWPVINYSERKRKKEKQERKHRNTLLEDGWRAYIVIGVMILSLGH